jgi:2-C-methyl-D-erythritol 4-phosphate cytidylyltransferase
MASTPRPFTTLVLAGRRESEDPLAEAAGASHRALLDIEGTPMLARVLSTLSEHPRIGRILLSMDAPELLKSIPSITSRLDSKEVVLIPIAPSPSRSVLNGLDEIRSDERLLDTTADHALLDDAMLDFFLDRAEQSPADVALALVPETLIKARFPDVQRTYLPFRHERYSGANLFAFLTPKARVAAEFWQHAEAHRKTPWKLVRSFGLVTLLLFLARRLDLEGAFRRVSRAIGVEVEAIEIPIAEASVDVDKISDLELVRKILLERRSG